jgi:hypothetical protein
MKKAWWKKFERNEERAKSNWREYGIRNKALAELGFASYAEYLASPLWQEIRKKRLEISSGCSCCLNPADVVHHDKYYKRLLIGDDASVRRDLYPLCHPCHRRVEFDGDRKRSSGEAVREFRRMLYKFKHGKSKGQMIREKIAARRS